MTASAVKHLFVLGFQAQPVDYRMTPLGWAFMICSIALVVGLVAYCYYRVLTNPPAADHMQAPPTIDTHDQGT